MVSCETPEYEARLVRLVHADESPSGPGRKTIAVGSSIEGTYPGRIQTARTGSSVVVQPVRPLGLESVSIQLWVWPTTPQAGRDQLLMRVGAPTEGGFTLSIAPEGDLCLVAGDDRERSVLRTRNPLATRRWYFVGATFDAGSRRGTVTQKPVCRRSGTDRVTISGELGGSEMQAVDGPIVMAGGTLNGKLAQPRIYGRALALEELERLAEGADPATVAAHALVAAWDFALDVQSVRVIDVSGHGLHGSAVNMPARAVTDHTWTGEEIDPRAASSGYGAIHFHDDDLEDAGWEPDIVVELEPGIRSGVYAAQLESGDETEFIPFVVVAPRGAPSASTALLLPTFTYQAYANERGVLDPVLEQVAWQARVFQTPAERALLARPDLGISLYDRHFDGSACFYASRLRPSTVLRPSARYALSGAPRNLAADLYLVDWLETLAFDHDILTDEILHAEGASLLEGYRVLISGSHPEYWSWSMLEAVSSFLEAGGRLMYLGGNGFYWVTSVHPDCPHMIEVRRGLGRRPRWGQEPGEGHHSSTGEPSGLWHDRGRPPHGLVGVGYTAEGRGGPAAGYTRLPDSFDERARFVFEGIGRDEVIGEFGLVESGVAGDEIDRSDTLLGTPPHALLLASSQGRHGDFVRLFDPYLLDEAAETGVDFGGRANPWVRADMVFFETDAGGAVFSVGSINWSGGLSHAGYENNVSQITENVLRRFLEPEPFRVPR